MIGEKEACLHERVLAIPIRQLRFSTRRQQQLHDAQLASAGGEMQRGAILHHFAPVDVNLRRSEERAHYDLVALVTGHVEGRHAEGVNLVRVRAGLEQLAQRDSIAVLRSAMQGGNGLLRRAALRVWCWEESTRCKSLGETRHDVQVDGGAFFACEKKVKHHTAADGKRCCAVRDVPSNGIEAGDPRLRRRSQKIPSG